MNKEFIQVFYIRLIVQLLIFYSNINPITKIILIFISDNVDSEVYRLKHKDVKLRLVEEYQTVDKINDIIGYILCHDIIYKNKLISSDKFKLLTYLLIYRIIGCFIVYKTKNRALFLLFVDLYKEVFLLFYFIKNKKLFDLLFIAVLFIKLYVEYSFHYNIKKYNV
uniref:Uncharacterized protein n=1 Tax=viral metagenome TaxID=1070528 RepID=A0A6C0HEI5_9ZZZZ